MRNENVEFSSPCGPPLAQISSIDLLVNVFEQEDYPNNKLSDLRIEVEKFMVNEIFHSLCRHDLKLNLTNHSNRTVGYSIRAVKLQFYLINKRQ